MYILIIKQFFRIFISIENKLFPKSNSNFPPIMDTFDLKKFLTENRLTSLTRRRPIMLDVLDKNGNIVPLEVDRGTIDLDGIDPNDYPDFADAYVMAADFVDGTPLTDDQLEKLTDGYIHDFVEDKLYEINRPGVSPDVEVFVEEHPNDYMYVVFDLRDGITPAHLDQVTVTPALQEIEEYQGRRSEDTTPPSDTLGSVQALLPDNVTPDQVNQVTAALIQICNQMAEFHQVDDPKTRVPGQAWVARKKSTIRPTFTPKEMPGGVEVLISPGFLV